MSAQAPPRNPLLVALADALAGALGSVVAVIAFYPIDIAKTRAQAKYGPSTAALVGRPGGSHSRSFPFFRSRTLAALISLVRRDGPLRLFEGIEAKALQSLVGSFVYFYAYAFIKGALRRRSGEGGRSLRPSLNLFAAALAGAVNQIFTLPLENITTKMQTSSSSSSNPPKSNRAAETVGFEKGGGNVNSPSGPPLQHSGTLDGEARGEDRRIQQRGRRGDGGTGMELGGYRDTRNGSSSSSSSNNNNSSSDNNVAGGESGIKGGVRRQSLWTVARQLYNEDGGDARGGLSRFWRGFTPSLILTCNPAINYTAFDFVKTLWLNRQAAISTVVPDTSTGGASALTAKRAGAGAASVTTGGNSGFLNPVEAFLIAAAAKSLATLITYPLIRAKVILMASSSIISPPPMTSPPLATSPSAMLSSPSERGRNTSETVTIEQQQQQQQQQQRQQEELEREHHAEYSGNEHGRSSSSSGGSNGTSRENSISAGLLLTGDDHGDKPTGVAVDNSPSSSSTLSLSPFSPQPATAAQGEASKTAPAFSTAAAAAAADSRDNSAPGNTSDAEARGGTVEEIADRAADTRYRLSQVADRTRVRRAGGGVEQMGRVMLDIVRHEGIAGLYAGCGAQLVHTILKSALLLTTKEEIARAAASAVFLGGERARTDRVLPPSR